MTLSLFYEEQAFPTLLICLNLRAALLTLPPVIYEEQAYRTLLICLNLRAALLTLPPVTTPLRVALFKC